MVPAETGLKAAQAAVPAFEVEVLDGLAGAARVEYFDLERGYGSLEAAFKPVSARTMFVSYRQDWRYPAAEAERMHEAMTAAGGTPGT